VVGRTLGHYQILDKLGEGGMGDPFAPFREVLALLAGDVEAGYQAGALEAEPARRLW